MFARRLLIFGLILFGSLIVVVTVRAQTEITAFTGVPQGNYVYLEWETSTEENLDGFYVTRKVSPDAEFTIISLKIDPQGSPDEGALYSFKDYGVLDGDTYYYRIQVEDKDGNEDYTNPITVTFTMTGPVPIETETITPTLTPTGPTPTPSLTPTGPTPTPSNTPTPSPTQPTRTTTPTLAPGAPTSTPVPGTATVTRTAVPNPLTPSPTVTSSPYPTASPTLEPLPSITLLFPQELPTNTPTPTPTLTPTEKAGFLGSRAGPTSPPLGVLAGIIIGVWGLLAGALILYVKRLGY